MVLLALGAAGAVNVPSVTTVGFSGDGRYVAVEAVWTQDGSGFPYRELMVLDVPRNVYARRARLGGEAWMDAQARLDAEYARVRAQLLRAFGIRASRPGTALYRAAGRSDQPSAFPRSLALTYLGRPVQVSVNTLPLPSRCDHPDPQSTRGLAVVVNGRVFQRDARLPDVRKCTFAYRLEEVRAYRNSAVILLRAFSPGFEGPDAWPMIVTGALR